MQNYYFDIREVSRVKRASLFALLYALIEVKYQATLYRAGVHTQLYSDGICSNVLSVLEPFETDKRFLRDIYIADLFFEGKTFPILPYSAFYMSKNNEIEYNKSYRWKSHSIGTRRMAMLDLMIKDLTHYLLTQG